MRAVQALSSALCGCVVAALLALAPAPAHAANKVGVDFGFAGGGGFATLLTGIDGTKGRGSWFVGPGVNLRLGPVTLSADAKFARRGGRIPTAINDWTYRLDYIDLPGILRFNIPLGAVRMHLGAGPIASCLVGAQQRIGSKADGRTRSSRNGLEDFVLGGVGVLGITMLGDGGSGFLEFRYQRDLSQAGRFAESIDNMAFRSHAFLVALATYF